LRPPVNPLRTPKALNGLNAKLSISAVKPPRPGTDTVLDCPSGPLAATIKLLPSDLTIELVKPLFAEIILKYFLLNEQCITVKNSNS
jgi:hypothetical protein